MDTSQCAPQLITAIGAEMSSLQGIACMLKGGKVSEFFPSVVM